MSPYWRYWLPWKVWTALVLATAFVGCVDARSAWVQAVLACVAFGAVLAYLAAWWRWMRVSARRDVIYSKGREPVIVRDAPSVQSFKGKP